jgi:hypothetical protein
VRASYRTGEPLEWTRVHDLPDFVYFNHSIHVAKGIGCASCHGPIQEMNLVYQSESLQMEWCLSCHRNPAPNVRPKEEVTNMTWVAADQDQLAAELMDEYHIEPRTDCSTCHR